MHQKSKAIMIASEVGSNVPVVLGECPTCGAGDRTMVLIDFVPNGKSPEHSTLYFKCLSCFNINQRRICDVAESE
jgi:phosphoribosyl 1,2-cyclic phosphodiesterase